MEEVSHCKLTNIISSALKAGGKQEAHTLGVSQAGGMLKVLRVLLFENLGLFMFLC